MPDLDGTRVGISKLQWVWPTAIHDDAVTAMQCGDYSVMSDVYIMEMYNGLQQTGGLLVGMVATNSAASLSFDLSFFVVVCLLCHAHCSGIHLVLANVQALVLSLL